jgi:hypothetical protein
MIRSGRCHIPESVDDEFVIQLLTVCGELRCLKRARVPYGAPKNFGIAYINIKGFAVFGEAV